MLITRAASSSMAATRGMPHPNGIIRQKAKGFIDSAESNTIEQKNLLSNRQRLIEEPNNKMGKDPLLIFSYTEV